MPRARSLPTRTTILPLICRSRTLGSIGAHRTTTHPTEFTDDGKRKQRAKTRRERLARGPRKPQEGHGSPPKKKFSHPKAPHRSTSHHDPPDRVHGRWEEETMAKITPTPLGTRATEALGGPRKPPKKKNFPSRRHPTPYICLRDFVSLPPGTIELSEMGTLFSSGHKTFSTWNFDVIFFREH